MKYSLNDIHYKLMILGSLISIKQPQSHALLALLVHNVHFCHWILTRLIMHYLKSIHAPSPQKINFDKIILKNQNKQCKSYWPFSLVKSTSKTKISSSVKGETNLAGFVAKRKINAVDYKVLNYLHWQESYTNDCNDKVKRSIRWQRS